MITGRQVRAARALLNWKQEMLAEKAVVALTALKRLESERGLPVQENTRDQVHRALQRWPDPVLAHLRKAQGFPVGRLSRRDTGDSS